MLDGHAGELVEQAPFHDADHEVRRGLALDGDAGADEAIAARQLGLLEGNAGDRLKLESDAGPSFPAVGCDGDWLNAIFGGFLGHVFGFQLILVANNAPMPAIKNHMPEVTIS